jgi:hypothetical protein
MSIFLTYKLVEKIGIVKLRLHLSFATSIRRFASSNASSAFPIPPPLRPHRSAPPNMARHKPPHNPFQTLPNR